MVSPDPRSVPFCTLMGLGVLPGSHPTFLPHKQGRTVSGCQQTEPPACPPTEGVWRSHGHNTGYGGGVHGGPAASSSAPFWGVMVAGEGTLPCSPPSPGVSPMGEESA